MDLFECLEDESDYYFASLSRPRKRREIRTRMEHFENYDDEEFRCRFRLTKASINYVLSLIEDDIRTTTNLNSAISPVNRLLLTLRYYATGCFLRAVADLSGVSAASACRIVAEVSLAIANLRTEFVKFPSNLQSVIHGFYSIARFPRVIGVIDCTQTHITIKSPGGDNAEYYRDRHGNFSMNVQTDVDHELKILFNMLRVLIKIFIS
ncbi:putative nuclease HARBI1 [Coccinella septempunctata]|uniref:putative nuclease HARBI1 n=1 Tax=Coccinella septempunctata TaxID=41139 RepID=UPI001D0850B1|nr:putative nuclease HARBI1 [Coccinella septempunctata]